MSFVAAFFVLFFVCALVIGPLLRIEDRPSFKWPNKKPRRMV
jgi:hypothetical protein